MSDKISAPWLQLTLKATQHPPEQLEDAFLQAGAIAVTLRDASDQPVLEPLPGETPLWHDTGVTGLFDAQTDIEVVKQALRHILNTEDLAECDIETLEERDWVRAWLDDFHPMRFGRRLWVCPTDQVPPEPTAVNLLLDPGLAFGTGTHPTTALCLEWLDGAQLTDQTVIDYGCGSGILAIAAARLGARQVWGVDIDAQALQASARNAERNQVAERLSLVLPEDLPAIQADLLLANIIAGPLIGLAPRFGTLVRGGGKLVLSGILTDQVGEVEAAFRPWFELDQYKQREDWVLIQAIRKD